MAPTRITDLDEDSLAHCARFLSLPDVFNLAITCKSLKKVAYSHSTWHSLFSHQWPTVVRSPSSSQTASEVKEAYLARRTAVHQFNFSDPFISEIYADKEPLDHLILNKNHIFFSQGSEIQMVKTNGMTLRDSILTGKYSLDILSDHKEKITCMRLFSVNQTSLFRGGQRTKEAVLATASYDNSIRLWWKGSCQRCFRGHDGPVTTLSDKLLGDDRVKVLASGGEDGTVRLWSLGSSVKHGQRALKATLYGHEQPVEVMSVAGHSTSLLVTWANYTMKVWDTDAASTALSSCRVGKISSFFCRPQKFRCHESLVFACHGGTITAIDLRTMKSAITDSVYPNRIYDFEILPSKSLICTGNDDKATLWDTRMNQRPERQVRKPVAELSGHRGKVKHIHMDGYKTVTGGPGDPCTKVWEAGTGRLLNSLLSSSPGGSKPSRRNTSGYSAMAVDECQMVRAYFDEKEDQGLLCYRDFTNATCPVA